MKRRIAIYCIYDKEGIVDDYILYCVESLKKMKCDVAIISNHILSEEAKIKLKKCDYIYERDDIGFDVGGISDFFGSFFDKNLLYTYDEAIILNDSIFGPFYDLDIIFQEMDKNQTLDFWGITKRGMSDFDGGNTIYEEHIQLYFYVIRSQMLHSKIFYEYWLNIYKRITDFRSAITNYEFEFTKYFESKGFSWDVFIRDNDYETKNPKWNLSPYHYDMERLVKIWNCPFIKRKLFTGDFVYLENGERDGAIQTLKWISKRTNYDIGLIWKHILRVYPLEELIDGMQLKKIVEQTETQKWESMFQMSESNILYWNSSNSEFDVEEKGEYAFICLFPNKRQMPYPQWRARMRLIQENLLAQQEGVPWAIKLFENDKNLGVVIPPMCIYGNVGYSILNKWQNQDEAKRLCFKWKLKIPFNENKAPIYPVDAIWCRKSFLKEFLLEEQRNMSKTLLQMLPLLAQNNGFYTTCIIGNLYAQRYIQDMSKILSTIVTPTMINEDISAREINCRIQSGNLNSFCKMFDNIYIYGAGEHAKKVYNYIDDKNKVVAFLVTFEEGNTKTIENKEVFCISKTCLQNETTGIIVTVGEKNRKQVTSLLKKKNIRNIMYI